ncbi:peptidoglycan/xylan/chitin deacetylase (PgdA/CDA1 family) [Phyllobacterium sp. 1468]|nr:peptidoglycan/xylan/chitin deacetylase (PgdA/CDA1 family) [Phyllobacterium sp. 1468]
MERLLVLREEYQVPLTLAVIPAYVQEQLARRLAHEAGVNVAVHGWSHKNHASADEKKQELGPHRSLDVMSAELGGGYRQLERLFADRFVPVLVPPWNRIDPLLLNKLPDLGFKALSVFGPPNEKFTAVVPIINAHVDLMDWHGTRGSRDHGQLVEAIVKELQLRFRSNDEQPIGILTHHLVHDDSAWDFLRRLFVVVAATPAGRWVSLRELL